MLLLLLVLGGEVHLREARGLLWWLLLEKGLWCCCLLLLLCGGRKVKVWGCCASPKRGRGDRG